MPITALSLAVVGADFPNKSGPTRVFAINLCRPGDPITLELEPENPVDKNAVRVLNREGMQMGYLTAERCGWIGSMIKEGRDIRVAFQEAVKGGAIVRATLDGSEPVIPAPQMRQRGRAPAPIDPEPDFYPDEVYPD